MCCTSEDVKRSVEGFKKDIGDKKNEVSRLCEI